MTNFNIRRTSSVKTRCYTGKLDQNEFVMRYIQTKKRIDNCFTRDELAFLLGKPPYFVIDYEELSPQAKPSIADIDLLNNILNRSELIILQFDTTIHRVNISNEKRVVRVVRKDYPDKIEYHFSHPWTYKGLREPLLIVEPICVGNSQRQAESFIKRKVLKLITTGYFNYGRLPNELYNDLWEIFKFRSDAWSPIVLKNAVYYFIRENKLTVESSSGRFTYFTKTKK